MAERKKLTKAQLELLRVVAEYGYGRAVESYRPRCILVERGLVVVDDRFSDILRITPEGRRVLSEEG